jgi:hypothetical protein
LRRNPFIGCNTIELWFNFKVAEINRKFKKEKMYKSATQRCSTANKSWLQKRKKLNYPTQLFFYEYY